MLVSRIAAVLVAAASLGSAVALGQTASPGAPRAALRAFRAGGAVQLGNSRDGQAILGADGLLPGQSVAGSVTIANEGDAAGEAALAPVDLADRPGPDGTPLSERLVLAVTDTERGTIYRGALGAMPALALGAFGPGERRTYQLEASLPDAGNGAQGAQASVGLTWTLVGEEPAVAPPPPPPPPPPPTPAPVRRRLTVALARAGAPDGRRVPLAVSCSRACRVTIDGSFVGTGRLGLAALEDSLAAGRSVVTIMLPRKARVTSRSRLELSVEAVARDGARDTDAAAFKLN